MATIEKNSILFTYSPGGSLVKATIVLVTEKIKNNIQGYEGVLSLECESEGKYATTVNFVHLEKEKVPVKVEIESFLACSETDLENDHLFFEELVKLEKFYFTARSAYYAYCRKKLAFFEEKKTTLKASLMEIEKEAKKAVQEMTSGLNDDEYLIQYANKYQLLPKDFNLENFNKKAENPGDSVYCHISMYGLHEFKLIEKTADGLWLLQGENKYYPKVPLKFYCCQTVTGLVVVRADLSAEMSHWYFEFCPQLRPDKNIDSLKLIRLSVKESIQDSVQKNIPFVKKGFSDKENNLKTELMLTSAIVHRLQENYEALKCFIRYEDC